MKLVDVLLISGSEIDLMKNCFVRVLAIEAAAQIKGGVRYVHFIYYLSTLFALVLALCLFARFRRTILI